MSYPKKALKNTQEGSKSNPKLPEARREKLLAIQQKEQLKGMLVNKFIEKYGKNKNIDQAQMEREIADFMKNEKLTEENLRKLEQRIQNNQMGKQQAPDTRSVKSEAPKYEQPAVTSELLSQKGTSHPEYVHHYTHSAQDDALSIASSARPRSVYQLGDEDDEWATMQKYDTELYKKEKELDQQLEEKKRVQEYEKQDIQSYTQLVQHQVNQYDVKEKKKEDLMKSKVMAEKYSRDKQTYDESVRKRIEKKTEKEIDTLLVKKIQNEIENEIRQGIEKRKDQKESLKMVLIENEERRLRMLGEAQKQKEEDIRFQQEYTRLIELQEAKRAAELKAREDRAKKFMNMMADTIIKDQKEQMLEDERKLLKHYLDREAKEIADDKMRQQRLREQKKDIKAYLDHQLVERDMKKAAEKELEKQQADIWKKDTADYYAHEKNKTEKIRDVNVKQAEFLKHQMEEERARKGKKMNTEELLMNKKLLKEIAEKDTGKTFQKNLVQV